MTTPRGARLLRVRAIEFRRAQLERSAAESAVRRIEALQERLGEIATSLPLSGDRSASAFHGRAEFLRRLDKASLALEPSRRAAVEQLTHAMALQSAADIAEQRVARLNDKARKASDDAADAKLMRQPVFRRTMRP